MHKLFQFQTILAHAVHLEDSEINLINNCKTSIAHCPASNTNLSSGFCDVKRILNAGIKVGLGTDISGGNKSSILSSIREALTVSHNLEFAKKQDIKGTGKLNDVSRSNVEYTPLNYKQAFYLATLGGAEALGKDNIIGNFVEGKEFDALIVDVDGGPIDVYDLPEKLWNDESELTLLQKFLYVGDDRNIKEVFVKGRQVK